MGGFGAVTTHGGKSDAIAAQSVGGGGNGGFSLSASGSSGAGSNTSIGGGGGGGVAKLVQVTNSGAIVTERPLSDGVYAQSVGGGGNGGVAVNGTLASGSGGMVSTDRREGRAGGAGGPVTVVSTGTILVKGAGSVGVFVQSIGGGRSGGFAGALNPSGGQMQNSVGGQGGNGGDASNVTVTSTGSILTLADNSTSVLAQSIGGGGNGTFAISAQTGAVDGSGLNIGGASNGTGGANGQVIVNVSGGTL